MHTLLLRPGRAASVAFARLGVLLVCGSAFFTSLSAQTTWSGLTGGWNTPDNWSGSLPDSSTAASITNQSVVGLTGTAVANSVYLDNSTLALTDSAALTISTDLAADYGAAFTVSGDDASFTAASLTLYTATTTIDQGATASLGVVYLANSADNVSTLTVRNGATFAADYLYAGFFGQSTVNVESGAQLTVAHDINVGEYSGSTGTLNISGSGTQVRSDFLKIGDFSTGTMTISDGAVVNSTAAAIAFGSLNGAGDVIGNVTVTGSATRWNITNDLGVSSYSDADHYNFGSLTIADGAVVRVGSTGAGPVTIDRGGTLKIGDGALVGTLQAGSLVLAGALVFNHTDNVALSAAISDYIFAPAGAGTITKNGSGTATLSGDNNAFTGAVTVNAGTLRATTSANALGAGALTLAGGSLALANDTALTFARPTTVTGNATVTSDRLNAGAGVTHTLGTLALGANTLSVTAGANVTSGTAGVTFGATTLGDAATFDVGSGAQLTLGAVGGAYSLTKSGAGTLVLGSASTRTTTAGSTTLNAGTLRLTTANALNTSSSAPLTLAGGNLTLGNNTGTTYNGTATTVTGNATVTADRSTSASTSTTHTLGTLSIGANTLSIARGSNITSTGTGGITFGTTTLTGGAIFDVGSNAQLTLGAVGGAYTLTKSGAGTLVLGTASTRSTTAGSTTLNAGTLRLTTANALNTSSSAGLTLAGGNLTVAANSATTFNGTATTVTGNATVTADRASSGSSSTTHTLGTLSIGANTLSTARGSNITSSGVGGIVFGATTLTGNATFSPGNNAQLTLASVGESGGARSLTKTGAGTLILSGDATHTGGTTISTGTLQVGSGAGTGTLAGAITNNATLAINRTGTITLAGDISGTGGLTKSGSGTLSLSGNNTFSGGITISGGSLLGSGSNPFGSGTITPTTSTSLGAIGGGSLTIANVVGGTATSSLAGTSTLTLTNSGNSFWTMSINSGGTLVAAANGALGSTAGQINVNSGTLAFTGGINYTSAKTVTFTGNGASGRNGAIDNLSGDNTFAGNLSLSGSDGRIGAATGTKLTLSGAIGQQISGWGATYAGPGTIVLSGTSSYTGTSTVSGGTLKVDGSLATSSLTTVNSGATLGGSGTVGALSLLSGATLAPGNSPGTLAAGATTLAGGSTFQFEFNHATGTAGTNWDLLSISGALTLTASAASPLTLDLVSLTPGNAAGPVDNFDPASDYTFTFVTTTAGITGFSADAVAISTTHFANSATGHWSVSLTNSGRDLSLNYTGASAVPEPDEWIMLAGLAALIVSFWFRRHATPARPTNAT